MVCLWKPLKAWKYQHQTQWSSIIHLLLLCNAAELWRELCIPDTVCFCYYMTCGRHFFFKNVVNAIVNVATQVYWSYFWKATTLICLAHSVTSTYLRSPTFTTDGNTKSVKQCVILVSYIKLSAWAAYHPVYMPLSIRAALISHFLTSEINLPDNLRKSSCIIFCSCYQIWFYTKRKSERMRCLRLCDR